jgi:hypothetical protein
MHKTNFTIRGITNSPYITITAMLFSLIGMSACVHIANKDKGKSGYPSLNEESDTSQSWNTNDQYSNHFRFHEEK